MEEQTNTVPSDQPSAKPISGWVCPKCGLNVVASAAFCPQDGTPFGDIGQEGSLMLSGRYEFISTIGIGGMSIIYKARQPLLDKIFAIKMLHTHLINEQTIQRFQQEAKAITTLKHHNVISVYDFGISEHGQPYMAMDFIDGRTLADEIKKRGSLAVPEAMDIFLQVCDALEHAHTNGILHRDLKPSNIMLIAGDTGFDVRLVDFGIAKIVYSESSVARQLTQTGDLFGSPLYMSPEHCMGKAIDARSDIYSLGCILYESLVGRPPHVGETMIETIFKHLNEAPTDLHEARQDIVFPQAVNEFVMKMLATDPDERYQNVQEVKAKLLEIQSGALRGAYKKTESFVIPKIPPHVRVCVVGALLAVAGLISLIYSSGRVSEIESSSRSTAIDTRQAMSERVSQLAEAAKFACSTHRAIRLRTTCCFPGCLTFGIWKTLTFPGQR